jgi:hypothetical protein
LSGNDLGLLANSTDIPVVSEPMDDDRLKQIVQDYSNDTGLLQNELHLYAKELLKARQVEKAWKVLLAI